MCVVILISRSQNSEIFLTSILFYSFNLFVYFINNNIHFQFISKDCDNVLGFYQPDRVLDISQVRQMLCQYWLCV